MNKHIYTQNRMVRTEHASDFAASQLGEVTAMNDFAGLTFALLRARESVFRRFRPVFHRQNITEQQSRVLRALTHTKQIEITELADATCLLPPSISRILRDLEARGLVRREISTADLRRNLISLTVEGRRLVQSSADEMAAIFDEIVEIFGKQRFDELYNLLTALDASLSEAESAEDTRVYG